MFLPSMNRQTCAFSIRIFFQIFYHKSHIWKVFIIVICFLNLYFLSKNLSQISQLKSFKYVMTNLTFERISSWTIVICFLWLWLWFFSGMNNLIMNNCNVFSQFIFFFKYFITNLTFERFSSWTIVICFLNSYCLSNILSQISHLKGSHHEQF